MGKARSGFSIIELMVAVGIMGTACLLVLGIFLTLFHNSQKSVDKTAGFTIAQSLMAQQVYQSIGSSAAATAFWGTPMPNPVPINAGNYQVNNANYFYKLYAQDVTLTVAGGAPFPLNCNITDAGPPGQTKLRRLDMVLWWWDASAPGASSTASLTMNAGSQQGYGLLQVHLSKLLWPSGAF